MGGGGGLDAAGLNSRDKTKERSRADQALILKEGHDLCGG